MATFARPQTRSGPAPQRAQQQHARALQSLAARNPILDPQQGLGNQVMQHLLQAGVIQARLKIGRPGDKYEQEAEQVAEAVMRMPDPGASDRAVAPGQETDVRVQRMCTQCEEELHRKRMAVSETAHDAHIQRICPACEEESHGYPLAGEDVEDILKEVKGGAFLQTKDRSGSTPGVTSDTELRIQALRGGGQPLPESVLSFFELRFGYDFSEVRIHTGPAAEESARGVNALAFTVGHDIVFGAGQYTPETAAGKRLLAHELTHVLQQGGTSPTTAVHADTAGDVFIARQRFRELACSPHLCNLLPTYLECQRCCHEHIRNMGEPPVCLDKCLERCPEKTKEEEGLPDWVGYALLAAGVLGLGLLAGPAVAGLFAILAGAAG